MAYSLFTARRVLSAHNMPVSGNPVCCSYFYMRQQHCRHLYSPQLPPTQSFHASTLRSRGYIHKPRHPLPSITLGELRKAYKQRKRNEPVANKELMALLNSLGDNNEGLSRDLACLRLYFIALDAI